MRRAGPGIGAAGALLVAFVAIAPARVGTVSLIRGPYLQLLTTHSVTVVWNTDEEADCGLGIGLTGEAPLLLTEPDVTTACAVTVDGLVPGEAYSYTAHADGVPLHEPVAFRADHPAAPFRVGIFGDSGTGSRDQLAVRDRMLEGGLDLLLHTGDIVYPHGARGDQNPTFFDPYRDLLRRMAFWPVLGNHDVETEDGEPWRDAYYTPANNPAHSERYYSFDRGNAHFVVLDSNASTAPGSAQYQFLDQDLATSAATWKIVLFHHTIYATGGNSDLTTRMNLVPLLDAYRVDAVFMGHVHNYARTKPLHDGRPVAPGAGTVYVTTGGGGGTLAPVSSGVTIDYAESSSHYTRLTVDGGTLLLEMIRADGAVRDVMMLVKSSTTTTTTTTRLPSSTTTSTVAPAALPMTEVRVAARADDAEERPRGTVFLGSSDLELVHDRHDQTVGLRFAPVDVPTGATIVGAWVQLKADEVQTRPTSLLIRGQAADDALPFTAARGNVSSRPRTGSGTVWSDVPAWPLRREVSDRQRTPDLTPVIQEIVSRAGWRRGNALVLIVTGKGRRTARSFDRDPGGAPLLHVDYELHEPAFDPKEEPSGLDDVCTRGLTLRVCATQPPPAAVARQVARACGLIARARQVRASRSRVLRTEATRSLRRAGRAVTRATREHRLSPQCAGALSSRIDDLGLAARR